MGARGPRRRRSSERVGVRTTLYSRAVACFLCGITERDLILWEREELITPARTIQRNARPEPLYDGEGLRRMRLIRTLTEELEVNLAGIGVILHMLERLDR